MANSKLELQKQKTARVHVYSVSQKSIQNKNQLNLSLNCKNPPPPQKKNQTRLHVYSESQEAEQNENRLNLSLYC